MEEADSIEIIGGNIIKEEEFEADISAEIDLNLICLNKKEIIFISAILNPIVSRIENRFIKI